MKHAFCLQVMSFLNGNEYLLYSDLVPVDYPSHKISKHCLQILLKKYDLTVVYFGSNCVILNCTKKPL